MQVGVIGLRGAGACIVRRLLTAGHQVVVFDESPRLVAELAAECAFGAASVADVATELDAPRTIILAGAHDTLASTIAELQPSLESGDIIVGFGYASNADAIRCACGLAVAQVQYVAVTVDGRLEDAPDGCRLTIGGEESAVRYMEPILSHIAPAAPRSWTGPWSAV